MYDYIKGIVDLLTPTSAVVEAGGVGYHLHISLHTYTQVGSNSSVKLYTHHIVREDIQLLYGFFSREERDVFRHLIGVSGVGGNTARMILSTFGPEEVCTIVATGQAEVLKSVKGLGIKTAQKIIVELRDKIGNLSSETTGSLGGRSTAAGSSQTFNEALSALTMLGFVRAASEKTLRTLLQESPSASVEELIRQALKKL